MRLLMGVVACSLLMVGCSGGGDTERPDRRPTPGRTAEATTPAATTPAASKPSATRPLFPPTRGTTRRPTAPVRVKKGMTRPGTRLRFGQKAIVPFRQYIRSSKTWAEGVLGIVVHPIRSAPGSAVQGNFDENSWAVLKRNTAYYAKVELTNEGGLLDFGGPADQLFDTYGAGKEPPTVIATGGELPQCKSSSPEAIDRKGRGFTTCLLAVSSSSRPIREVHYDQPPYGTEIPPAGAGPARFNRHYGLGSIVWR